jgi:hypothetical protein
LGVSTVGGKREGEGGGEQPACDRPLEEPQQGSDRQWRGGRAEREWKRARRSGNQRARASERNARAERGPRPRAELARQKGCSAPAKQQREEMFELEGEPEGQCEVKKRERVEDRRRDLTE